MQKMSDKARVVEFQVKYIYVLSAVVPFITIGLCWACYYGLKHNKNRIYPVLTISETVELIPESRIFNIGMTIEAFLQGIVFVLRQHYLHTKIRRESSHIRKGLKYVTTFCSFFSPFLLIGLANFVVSEFFLIHMSTTILYFVLTLLYFFLYDILLYLIGPKPKFYSYFVVLLAMIASICSVAFRNAVIVSKVSFVTISSISQYLAVFLLCIKSSLTIFEIPSHGIRFFSK